VAHCRRHRPLTTIGISAGPCLARFGYRESVLGQPALFNAIDGIIALGGGIDVDISAARDQLARDVAAERLVMLATLGRRYPQARLGSCPWTWCRSWAAGISGAGRAA
jgi:hypothetical protein